MPSVEPIVLDTHSFIWAYTLHRVSPRVTKKIDAAGLQNELYIAAVTPLEIAMAARAQRLRLTGPVLQWLETALQRLRVGIAPLDPSIAVDSVDLPGNWKHSDPFDRVIVATARHLGAVLITADGAILDYAAKVKAVRVLEPS